MSGGDVRRVTRFVPPAWRVAAAGSGAGVLVMYLGEAQQSTAGRVSALVNGHVMPYLSVVTACYAVAVGALVSLATRGSVARGAALGAAAGLAAIAATPADVTWHSSFGTDGSLWSPPHLLSVLGTAALIAAVLAVTAPGGGAGRVALGAALIAVTQVVVVEYDMDVPRYSGALYLPLLVCTGLGGAWVVHRTTGARYAVSRVLAVFLLFRACVPAVADLVGLPGPDLPVALLGLAVVDVLPAQWRRIRWPLAGLAVTAGQVVASVTGVSSVSVAAVADAAAVVVPVLVFSALLLVFGRVVVPVALVAGLVGWMPLFGPPVARAHEPGSGPQVGTADVTVRGDGAGVLDVAVSEIRGLRDVEFTGARLVARRAGHTVTGDVLRPGMSATGPNRVGSISLPRGGLWFVYLEWPDGGRHRELWRAVEYDTAGATVERRRIYWAAPESRSTAEYLSGLLLYGLSVALVGWAATVVRDVEPTAEGGRRRRVRARARPAVRSRRTGRW